MLSKALIVAEVWTACLKFNFLLCKSTIADWRTKFGSENHSSGVQKRKPMNVLSLVANRRS